MLFIITLVLFAAVKMSTVFSFFFLFYVTPLRHKNQLVVRWTTGCGGACYKIEVYAHLKDKVYNV